MTAFFIKNYKICDNLAYTEDQVVVHKLYVHSIRGQITPAALKSYFSRFGEVLDANITSHNTKFKGKTLQNFAHGYVLFKEAASATKALMVPHRISDKQSFQVKASFTWLQPNAPTVDSLPNDMVTDEDKTDLADLNDYCLEAICRNLSLPDRIRFAMSCKRWTNIFVAFFKQEYKTFDVTELEFLTLWQQRIFFQLMGSHITEITGVLPYKIRTLAVDYIAEHCANLKTLTLRNTPLQNRKLRKLLLSLKNLTELHMDRCMLIDYSMSLIKQLRSLESLSLRNNDDITGQHIKAMQSLKRLNLNSCINLSPSHFENICKSLKLRELDIRNCLRLGASQFKVLGEFQNELEVLKLSGRIHYTHIFQLPALKTLQINNENESLTREFFNALAEKSQLQDLRFFCRNVINEAAAEKIGCLKELKKLLCPNNKELNDACLKHFRNLENLEMLNVSNTQVTDQGLLTLLKVCTKLQWLEVELCPGITGQFYRDAIEVLKKRFGDSTAKLTVKVCMSKIDPLQWSSYEDPFKSLLKLDFTANPLGALNYLTRLNLGDSDDDSEISDDDWEGSDNEFFMIDSDGEVQINFYDSDFDEPMDFPHFFF